jgi:3-deoxy-manno-octulosonate cytidylyltransferase (CMP-KDO synthetase)
MNILAIIPARYASTRFPAKALANIKGKSMVQRVYEQCKKSKSLTKVIVATDHELIYNEVKNFGGEVVMTALNHQSGTDRCFEALQKIQNENSQHFDFVINIQGDEPFIQPAQIDILAQMLTPQTQLATLIKKITDYEQLFDINIVKVICNIHQQAIYFSRHAIPFQRNIPQDEWINQHHYFKHIGIYAYRTDILEKITQLIVSPLEKAESLEQLRWLENGFSIQAAVTQYDSHGIDTPQDLEKVLTLNLE